MVGLDVKDTKILAELDSDARQPNSRIGKTVGLSKEAVKYRIDRLIGSGVVLRFHTVINYFKLGIVKFKLYLRFTRTNKQKIDDIGEFFKKHQKTEWVAATTGRWDMIVGFLVHNVNELDNEVQSALNLFSEHIQEKTVTTTLYLAHQTRSFLKQKAGSGGHVNPRVVYHTAQDPQEIVAGVDEEIMRVLANCARLPVTDIARRVKATPRVVHYRLRELEKKNIILAYKAHIDPKRIGRIFCKLIVYMHNIDEKTLKTFMNYASILPGAVWPQRVLGAWDFELDLEVESYDAFQDIILHLKEKFPQVVRDHEFCIVSNEFKLDLYPGAYRGVV